MPVKTKASWRWAGVLTKGTPIPLTAPPDFILLLLHALAVIRVAFLFDHLHPEELVRVDLVQSDPHAHGESRPQIQRVAKQLPGIGQLHRVQTVQRAVIAALVLAFESVRTEARVAQLISPQRPVNQAPQRRRLGPLAL